MKLKQLSDISRDRSGSTPPQNPSTTQRSPTTTASCRGLVGELPMGELPMGEVAVAD